MNRSAGLAIGAAVLSVTVGVLVGIVIHAGQVERADQSSDPAVDVVTSAFSGSSTSALQPSQTSPLVVPSSDDGPSTAPPVTVPSSAIAPTSSMSTPTSPSSTPTSSMSSTAGTPGVEAADAPCPTLADRSSDSAGTTLYCQVDQSDRTLRWRAVVDGGGCLNQTMTGVGADGVAYACRLDGSGRNHWAVAG